VPVSDLARVRASAGSLPEAGDENAGVLRASPAVNRQPSRLFGAAGPFHPVPHHGGAVPSLAGQPEVFHGPPHLSAPVGIFGCRARKVLLLAFLSHVFLIDQPQDRGRSGEESYYRLMQLARKFGNPFGRAFI